MSDLAALKTLTTQKLGQSSTGFHTASDRTAAINEAILQMAEQYGADIIELTKKATLTITSGEAAKPSDFLYMLKVWDISTATQEWDYMAEDEFDELDSDTANKRWTVGYSTTASAIRLKFTPSDTTSVFIRYVIEPTTLSSDSDSTELPSAYDEAIGYWAASILFKNEHNEAWQLMRMSAEDKLRSTIQSRRRHGGAKMYKRLKSKYEDRPLIT